MSRDIAAEAIGGQLDLVIEALTNMGLHRASILDALETAAERLRHRIDLEALEPPHRLDS
jgi:hypothetical protein